MSARSLRFYFDFISPYAYVAWTQIHGLAARHGRAVEPVPVLFAALLDANGQKGPAEIPRKRIYVFKDTLRIAHALGVPFAAPPSHPFNPLLALRIASTDLDPASRRQVIDTLFGATWGGGPGVADVGTVARLLEDAGLDGARLTAVAQTDAVKARVRAQTDDALAAGAFGVPSILADGELFWGLDSFPHVERRLEGKDPLDAVDFSKLRDVRPSAQRKA